MSEKRANGICADATDNRHALMDYCDQHLVLVFLFLIVLLGILSYVVGLANT